MSDLTDAIEAAAPRLTVALWNAAHGRGHAVDGPRIAVTGRTGGPTSDSAPDDPEPAETLSGPASGGVYTGPPIPTGTHGCVTDHPRHSAAQEGER